MPASWEFSSIWNQSLEEKSDRQYEVREHIWASEIGGSFVDRYLKMKGIKPTNPPNPRSRRKFEAGNIWESIVGYVLSRAGILIKSQEHLKYQYEGLLPVTGRLDFIAGGQPDYDKAIATVKNEFNWLPEFVGRATVNIVLKLRDRYREGLKDIILEIKSCSSYMFEIYERHGTAAPQHQCQNFHYLKAKEMDEGHIVYISKDDARLIEIPVFNPSDVEDMYKKDIGMMTHYFKNDEMPPLEKPIIFDESFKKFSANWKISYSPYLSMNYGLENQMEFDNKYKPVAEKWNRVLARAKEGKEMTDSNKQYLDDMKREGFDVERILEFIKEEK